MRLTRSISLFFVFVLLMVSSGLDARAQTSVAITLSTNLSLGSSGPQVITLQKILNQSADTRIASVGAGSSGNETTYFGLLTQAAVMRFQNKYASQVLAPAGLHQATGFVGSYTRSALNAIALAASNSNTAINTSTIASPPPTTAATSSQNPNLQNAPQFLALIDSEGVKQGLTSDAITKMNQAVLQQLATTTDLQAAFLKQAKTTSGQSLSMSEDSLFGTTLATIKQAFKGIFAPDAYAVAGTPFGGALFFSFFCNESDTWLIALTPLPPSYAVLLTYEPGTESFASYNIPATPDLLGFYAPGTGVCLVGACPYCYYIPNEGMISPFVGSAP